MILKPSMSIFSVIDIDIPFIDILNKNADIDTMKLILRLSQVNKYYNTRLTKDSIYHNKFRYIKECLLGKHTDTDEIADEIFPKIMNSVCDANTINLTIDVFQEKHYDDLLESLYAFADDDDEFDDNIKPNQHIIKQHVQSKNAINIC